MGTTDLYDRRDDLTVAAAHGVVIAVDEHGRVGRPTDIYRS
ncbi:MAG: hypothetical protein ACYDEP_03805 [Acidimicrobiales bacterium]|jgi:hypothetical protein